jgi:hypothetical protein
MSVVERLFRGRRQTSALQEEVVELTNQFYVTLRAYFAKVKANGKIRNQEAFNRVEELLKPDRPQTWNEAYEIEQLLVHLFEDDTLAAELDIRTMEARAVLRPALADYYVKEVGSAKVRADLSEANPKADGLRHRRRALLGRLVNDLQWRYIRNEATRRYSKLITGRTTIIFVIALLAFAAVMVPTIYGKWTFAYGDWSLLLVAGFAGAWGATFSLLTSLKGRLEACSFDELKMARAWVALASRALIGAGAACILLFFLLSGFLAGSSFPTLAADAASDAANRSSQGDMRSAVTGVGGGSDARTGKALPNRDLALLIVWCFLAGFSEQLIPGLLAKTEARANGAQLGPPDRYRPTMGATPVQPPPPAGTPRLRPGKRDTQREEIKTG